VVRTGVEKLQGLAHAIARGLVSLKHQGIHDAVVNERIPENEGGGRSGGKSIRLRRCGLDGWSLGDSTSECGEGWKTR
jgi:hypothetical protein